MQPHSEFDRFAARRSAVAAACFALAATVVGVPGPARANTSSWTLNTTLSDGAVTNATATFNWTSGGTLSLTIIDTGSSAGEAGGKVTNPDVISGIFFNTDVTGVVGAVTAFAPRSYTGSTIVAGSAGNYTGAWQMLQNPGTNANLGNQTFSYGMGAAGYAGIFSSGSFSNGFGGGLDGSIVGSGNCTAGTGAGTSCQVSGGTNNQTPLAVGELDLSIASFIAGAITAVTFTYGTNPDGFQGGTSTSLIPEPSSIVVLGSALLGFGLLRRRRA